MHKNMAMTLVKKADLKIRVQLQNAHNDNKLECKLWQSYFSRERDLKRHLRLMHLK